MNIKKLKRTGKYLLIFVTAVLLILSLTNPSLKDFNDYRPTDNMIIYYLGNAFIKADTRKSNNYFIYSEFDLFYGYNTEKDDYVHIKRRHYIGVFNTFYEVDLIGYRGRIETDGVGKHWH